VLKLYDLLHAVPPSPVVTFNRAVAVAMVDGPRSGLVDLDALRRRAPASSRAARLRPSAPTYTR